MLLLFRDVLSWLDHGNSESYNCWPTRGADNSWHDGVDFPAHVMRPNLKFLVYKAFCLQCFLASRSFPMCWLLASDDQSMRASASYSNEFSGFISSRIDWFYLFGVQGTLKSLLQYCSSKSSILRCSVFFMVQFSHLYMTTGKTQLWLYNLC